MDARFLCNIWAFALTGVEVREGLDPRGEESLAVTASVAFLEMVHIMSKMHRMGRKEQSLSWRNRRGMELEWEMRSICTKMTY